MTIFLNAIKELLPKYVTETIDLSNREDISIGNQVSTFVGFGRNITLSTYKRGLLDQLLLDLVALQDDLDDQKTNTKLFLFLQKFRDFAVKANVKYGASEGRVLSSICKLQDLVSVIYDKLQELGLTDIPDDMDPLHIFYSEMAHYTARKIAIPRDKSALTQFMKTTLDPTDEELSQKKATLVKDTLILLRTRLDRLDHTKKTSYLQAKKDTVLETIADIRQKNRELCAELSPKVSLPGVEFRPTAIQRSHGSLEETLNKAFIAITTPMQQQISHSMSQGPQKALVAPPPAALVGHEPVVLADSAEEEESIDNESEAPSAPLMSQEPQMALRDPPLAALVGHGPVVLADSAEEKKSIVDESEAPSAPLLAKTPPPPSSSSSATTTSFFRSSTKESKNPRSIPRSSLTPSS